MAIQMRRGDEADLDISRLLPGELAICLDTGKVIIKLAGGNYLTLTDSVALSALISGKADASHTHAQSDVTGLETVLSGKAAASHTHTKSQITDLANAVASTNGSGGSAGLMSANDKEKLNGINIAVLTQAQYEALDPPDSGTLYLIPEEAS